MNELAQLKFTVVVMGKETTVYASTKTGISDLIVDALRQARDTGQPPDQWELKYKGTPLSPDKTVHDYNLPDNAILRLDLKAGAGGCV